jgi:transposase
MDLILFYIDFIVMTYSLDLRQRVMDFVASGGGKTEAARRFSVGRQTVYDWLKREDLAPKRYVRTKMKLDPEALRAYVAENDDAYLYEIGAHFSV